MFVSKFGRDLRVRKCLIVPQIKYSLSKSEKDDFQQQNSSSRQVEASTACQCKFRLVYEFYSARELILVGNDLFLINRSNISVLPDAVAGVVHNVPPLDTTWIESTNKKAALKLEKLDTDLKNYKSNSIKESIRLVGCSTCM